MHFGWYKYIKKYIYKFLATIIEVTSCNDWNYESISNSLQMKLITSISSSSFFYVNKISQLPINGKSFIYNNIELLNKNNIGYNLLSVLIGINDKYGYCIKELSINLNGIKNYIFNSKNYFGNGIILSSNCKYSYKVISSNLPLILCIDNNYGISSKIWLIIYIQ